MIEEMSALKRKRGVIKKKIGNCEKFVNSIKGAAPENRPGLIETELRLNNYEPLLREFQEIQSLIETECDEQELEEQMEVAEEFENKYYPLLAFLKEYMFNLSQLVQNAGPNLGQISGPVTGQSIVNPLSAPTSSSHSFDLQSVKLPTIKLPIFRGDYEHWLEFKSNFISIIHTNLNIGNIQKFQYLRSSLEGYAKRVIDTLEFTESNYETAWELLCKRFDNTRILVNNHIKAIFGIDLITKESASQFRQLLDTVSKHMAALKVLKQPVETWDILVIHVVVSKLDKNTQRQWEENKTVNELPTLDELFSFLKSKADVLETLQTNQVHGSKDRIFLHKNNARQSQVNVSISNPTCNYCKGKHLIYSCDSFKNLAVTERIENAKKLKLCLNCLKLGHPKEKCFLGPCPKCKQRHNTLLHIDNKDNIPSQNEQAVSTVMLVNPDVDPSQVLLSTVILRVKDVYENDHYCRALLDCGAQSNLITHTFFSKLNLPSSKTNLIISGINQVTSNLNKKCNLSISSNTIEFETKISCYIIHQISNNLPSQHINSSKWQFPENIVLADPRFNQPGEIDMLIGANLFWEILLDGKINLGKGLPFLQNTMFGWVIAGSVPTSSSRTVCNFIQLHPGEDDLLKKFWEIEEVPNDNFIQSIDDIECETLFQKDTVRDKNGRFVVKFPLKYSPNLLGDSLEIAKRRFYSLEKKFESNIHFKNLYKEFIHEYIELGHMSKLSESDMTYKDNHHYYLPHHGVLKESSITTKLRAVFDGSCKTTSGWSLNDLQYTGPKVQNDIFPILLRFRTYNFVVSADVSKMYRQIIMNDEHQYLQQIVWRDSPNDNISIYKLNTVTYGTKSAPYLAMNCLRKLASEYENEHPNPSKVIHRDFYVDDLLTGNNDSQELNSTCRIINSILSSGGFQLRKWISNDANVLSNIEHCHIKNAIINLGEHEGTKTLGVQWLCESDTLGFVISLYNPPDIITKRHILSDIARIYDPLGVLSPCIIISKIIIQRLWELKLSWDEEIPSAYAKRWKTFRYQLNLLNSLKIPRNCLKTDYILTDIHCFCDASQEAYATCIYLRSQGSNGKFRVQLLCSKSKVAPLKPLSIPKLELSAALLGAQLLKQVLSSLSSNVQCYLWSDSQVTLYWLNTHPSELQVFVANRVSKIQEITNISDWKYVNTKDNPADLASRGLYPEKLLSSTLWYDGPQFLYSPQGEWPQLPFNLAMEEIPELKIKTQVFTTVKTDSHNNEFNIFNLYSSLTKLKRVTAFCFRFIQNLKLKKDNLEKQTGLLTISELSSAFNALIKISQQESFKNDIMILVKKGFLDNKHHLSSLSPFIDDSGLLRVGGRLRLSSFDTNIKHPILLSAKHNLARLLFVHKHHTLLHPGPQLLLSSIRQNFWVVGGRTLARQTVKSCLTCFKYKPDLISMPMGQLPEQRLKQSFPFEVTGIDYAGPLSLKDRKTRGFKIVKCYICIFICFSTKAIHLEAVTDMTTECFIACLRRFTSRRGIPAHIYSDNGTTFVGAKNELHDLGQYLSQHFDSIINQTSLLNIVWHFIPPYTPNFGGLWESAVKSTKHHLKRVMQNTILTYEEISTLLTQIESVLNSRPLFALSNDPNDLEPITPSHFLIGRVVTSLPDYDLSEVPTGKMSRFQLVQNLQQQFWIRFNKEYVTQLHQQYKWKGLPTPLTNGTLVLVKNDKLPPNHWMLGRIIELLPGHDGIPRIATIKVSSGVIKRSTRHLCILPLQSETIH